MSPRAFLDLRKIANALIKPGLVTTSRLVFSYGTTWRLLVQTGSHGTERNLIRTVQKSASGKFAGVGIDERASFFAM